MAPGRYIALLPLKRELIFDWFRSRSRRLTNSTVKSRIAVCGSVASKPYLVLSSRSPASSTLIKPSLSQVLSCVSIVFR